MITKDQLFVGLRLKDNLRVFGPKTLIVTEITEKGFKYTWTERLHLGPRFGYTDCGEMYEISFENLEIEDKGQRPN